MTENNNTKKDESNDIQGVKIDRAESDLPPVDKQKEWATSYTATRREHLEKELKTKMPLLFDPALLFKVKQTYLDPDIIGEDTNKLLLFLILSTSYTPTPLGAIVTGESSAGKSHLVNKVIQWFDNAFEYSRITAASPDRSGQDFNHKILYIGELYGAESAQNTLRVLISEGKLKLWTTTRDDDGHITTEEIETKGVPSFITTTTTIRPEEELLNRLFIISTDETQAQTRRILEFEAQRARNIPLDDADMAETKPRMLSDYLAELTKESSNQAIPYADRLAKMFPATTLKARRDFKKLLAIISASTFIHQLQRPLVYRPPNRLIAYTLALPIDLYIALRVCDKSLRQTLFSMQDRAMRVLNYFNEHRASTSISVGKVAEAVCLTESRTAQILNALSNQGYLDKEPDPSDKRRNKYTLKHEETHEIISMSDLSTFFKSYDETELRKYFDELELISLEALSSFPKEAVDPLTGRTRTVDDMLNDLGIKTASASASRDITSEQPKLESTSKARSVAEYSSESAVEIPPKSEAEAQSESPSVILAPIVVCRLISELKNPFTREQFLSAVQRFSEGSYKEGDAQNVLRKFMLDAQIYESEPGVLMWARY